MIRVLLVNQARIPHYRIPIYGALGRYLHNYGFEFMVVSDGIQPGNPHPVEFQYVEIPLSVWDLTLFIWRQRIDIIISWVDMKHLYLFPMHFIAKVLLGKKVIYWGQGRDLLDKEAKIKNLAYTTEQAICDAIILYAEHLRKYVPHRFHKKVFVANNTLSLSYPGLPPDERDNVLEKYGIRTKKNIICIGRMQKRKRLECLVKAFDYMNRSDTGLILVGPDPEGVLNKIDGDNIYKLGSIYGDEKFDLLSASDVYCLPGAVGLSIIDAFYCGLPLVTEEGDESAEIMYLRNGVNGFVVTRGNIVEMAQKLQLLLDNDVLRRQFSDAAKREISENASIDKLCAGFRDALWYVTNTSIP
ncbi:MAG: glycosyltransferase family 4 protein [Deltaproteobacteria bacterium]|nr:glycosyltransferase family 4 protein [Deltaproteobacteria bacterium]